MTAPRDGFAGRGPLEVDDHAVDRLHQFGEECAVVTEVGPQELGGGEGEHAMGQAQQEAPA